MGLSNVLGCALCCIHSTSVKDKFNSHLYNHLCSTYYGRLCYLWQRVGRCRAWPRGSRQPRPPGLVPSSTSPRPLTPGLPPPPGFLYPAHTRGPGPSESPWAIPGYTEAPMAQGPGAADPAGSPYSEEVKRVFQTCSLRPPLLQPHLSLP